MDFDALYLRSLKFLGFRPRSEKEMRDYLKKKIKKFDNIDISIIDLIIHKLKEQRFLNDLEFTKMWVRSRTEFKPKGERLIRWELQQKGIDKETVDKAFTSFDFTQEENSKSARNDTDLAIDFLTRKKKKYEGMESRERFNKAGSMLARRGFSLDVIKAAIDSVFGKMV